MIYYYNCKVYKLYKYEIPIIVATCNLNGAEICKLMI